MTRESGGGRVLAAVAVGRLRDVRVRTIELRILAIVLVVLWFAAFGLVLVGYRPGGPVDVLVGIAAAGPILIAITAVAWPPVARGDRAFAAIAWLALVAMLLLVPSIAGLVTQLVGRGPQTLLPSFEAAYPWLVALFATALFAGLGIARRRLGGAALRRRRLVLGAGFAVLMVLMTGSLFSTVAIVNKPPSGIVPRSRPASARRIRPPSHRRATAALPPGRRPGSPAARRQRRRRAHRAGRHRRHPGRRRLPLDGVRRDTPAGRTGRRDADTTAGHGSGPRARAGCRPRSRTSRTATSTCQS